MFIYTGMLTLLYICGSKFCSLIKLAEKSFWRKLTNNLFKKAPSVSLNGVFSLCCSKQHRQFKMYPHFSYAHVFIVFILFSYKFIRLSQCDPDHSRDILTISSSRTQMIWKYCFIKKRTA